MTLKKRPARERRAEPLFLLIYHLRVNEVVFVRAGTHAELFGC
jgi:mRNA-degrading endonuclease YafQ of YafQ-DinJ toxin-antitoxin module